MNKGLVFAQEKPRLLVIGAGYVGLVSAACWAKLGFVVDLVDCDVAKIAKIGQGQPPFHEPGLELLLQAHVGKELLPQVDLVQALQRKPKYIFLCVGTPAKVNGDADLTALWSIVKALCKNLQQSAILICKSTVPIGTSSKVQVYIDKALKGKAAGLSLVFAPEFLSQGQAVTNCLQPDRLVFGLQQMDLQPDLLSLHQEFVLQKTPIYWCDFATAELAKYAANCMLAMRISFINQMAMLAECAGGNVDLVAQIVGADKRIGTQFLAAGIGFGGSCFPKDLLALKYFAKKQQQPFLLGQATLKINQLQRQRFLAKILQVLGVEKGLTIGFYGLAFKSGTDDLRESPGLWLAEALLDKGFKLLIFDPLVKTLPECLKAAIQAPSFQALLSADALVIAHQDMALSQFKPNDFVGLRQGWIFDARNNFSPDFFVNSGLKYCSIGRSINKSCVN